MENQKPRKLSKLSTKRKPLKVVYISNPMKVNANIADFRALVQRLTGQHSVVPDSVSVSATDNCPSSRNNISQTQQKQSSKETESGSGSGSGSRSEGSFDGYGEVYMPELVDSLPDEILTSDWWNE